MLALADRAKYFKLPTILSTSFEDGPNGPLVPELKQTFPDAPFIARPGQINAWDKEDSVKAVKATGKKQLIIAGVVTSPSRRSRRLSRATTSSSSPTRRALFANHIPDYRNLMNAYMTVKAARAA